jgi:hypothetical protein
MGKIILFGILLVGLTSAGKDTVVLTTGESIEGHMLSADENTVRFRDTRGIVQEIPRDKISTIRLQTAPDPGPGQKQSLGPAVTPEKSPTPGSEIPEQQKDFCELVASFQKEQLAYAQETNPIRKAGMRIPDPYRYESQVRDSFGPKHEFVNWTGTLRFGTSGRSIGVTFTPTCDPQQLIQFGNAIEQPGFPVRDTAGTIIRVDSPIGRMLASAQTGQQAATVSGHLIPVPGFVRFNQALSGQVSAGYGKALFRSQMNPTGASIAQPNYLVKFTEVNLLEKAKAGRGAR